MRVCLVYDCLFPHTVGGAERWYRHLAERLAEDGHEVTYLTLRQWPRGEPADFGGVRVRPVGPRLDLYVRGRRRILPPILFGFGVLGHLLARGRRYDVVHTASFPYFALLAIGLVRVARRFAVVVDWWEVWTLEYWREYLGRIGGRVGWLVQRLCMRVPQRVFCFSQLQARRLRAEGFTGPLELLEGAYTGDTKTRQPLVAARTVVFAGRHIPEKRVPALIPAVSAARSEIPDLSADIFGEGPEHARVAELISEYGLSDAIRLRGFTDAATVESAMAHAFCHVLPSRREGYGLVVVEAAALGTPSVVVAGADNAAVELIEEGVNGFIAPSASAEDLAEAMIAVWRAGQALRESTAAWFAANRDRLSLESSLGRVLSGYQPDRPLTARR